MSHTPVPEPRTTALPSLPSGWHILSYKVLAGSRLAIVGVDADIVRAWRSDYEQKTLGETRRLAAKAAVRVWICDDAGLWEGPEFPLLEPFPVVDQFPDGRWLVANSRSGGQQNARILSVPGTEERRFELGDGIEHIKIDDRHRIWVGWFDEGVVGNRRWRVPGLKWPPAAYGLAAFDDCGEIVTHAPTGRILDCYALNVLDDAAWACTYTDFPIWQLTGTVERMWDTDLRGTRALAVRYPHVLAAGGYGDESNRIVLLRLDGHRAVMLGEWRLPPVQVSMIDGRGEEIHAVENHVWHRWSLTEFQHA